MRTKILVLNFFELYPPKERTFIRLWSIYNNLSKWFDISYLAPSDLQSDKSTIKIKEHNPHFTEYLVNREKPYFHSQYNKLIKIELSKEIGGLFNARSARYPTNFHKKYMELYPEHDIIIHQFPFMANFDLFLGLDDKPRIYSSISDEYLNAYFSYKGKHREKYLNHIRYIENKLCNSSKKIFITANFYRDFFINRYKINKDRLILIPDCPDIENSKKIFNLRKKTINKNNTTNVVFIGHSNSYSDNQLFKYLNEKLSKKRKNITFYIIGNFQNKKYKKKISSNIKILFGIPKKELDAILIKSNIAIASSEYLILTYLSIGIPTIAYYKTKEGINLKNTKLLLTHKVLDDIPDLIKKLENTKWEECESASNEIIQEYNWLETSKKIKNELELL